LLFSSPPNQEDLEPPPPAPHWWRYGEVEEPSGCSDFLPTKHYLSENSVALSSDIS
ncbi:unnamed protein product, partial [Musa acuminata var. zebrina]